MSPRQLPPGTTLRCAQTHVQMAQTSAAAAGPPKKTVSSSSEMTVLSLTAHLASAFEYSIHMFANSDVLFFAVGPSASAR